MLLGEAAAEGRGIVLAEHSQHGRAQGHPGSAAAREPGTIGFAALRGGSVAGDHSVYLLGDDERIVLSHLAEHRAIFAKGAVKAANWLIGRAAGRYTMAQVLGL